MFRIGAIDHATMRHFDERCLTGQEDGAEPAGDASTIKLSVKDFELFVAAFSNPREPSREMRERVANYLAGMGKHRDQAHPNPCTMQGSGQPFIAIDWKGAIRAVETGVFSDLNSKTKALHDRSQLRIIQ